MNPAPITLSFHVLDKVFDILRSICGMRALILVPCCKRKRVNPAESALAMPLPGIDRLRAKIIELLQSAPHLRERPENRRGALNPSAPLTRAIDLYAGAFYRKARGALLDVLDKRYPHAQELDVHVLIVSALYGLVRLDEGIREYELIMTDELPNGVKVHEFWQEEGLWRILLEYIRGNGINYIWSLLPSSKRYPYHQVFEELWRALGKTSVRCIHVKIPGSAAGVKRAEWLERMVEDSPLQLAKPLTWTSDTFQYTTC